MSVRSTGAATLAFLSFVLLGCAASPTRDPGGDIRLRDAAVHDGGAGNASRRSTTCIIGRPWKRCEGSVLRTCTEAEESSVDCATSGQRCAFSSATRSYACESPPDGGADAATSDECTRLGDLGECVAADGVERARYCVGGALYDTTCADDQLCDYVEGFGYECVTQAVDGGVLDAGLSDAGTDAGIDAGIDAGADECARLGYYGECSGGTLRYCLSGSLEEVHCAARGQACTLVDETTGYDCR